jgi:hypothetical protein
MFQLPKSSVEQNNIINELKDNNVIVDSVAGSGKTTTNLYIAQKYTNSKILLLTYNAKLKIETRNKVKLLSIKNLETHSYHSFCVKYYNRKCYRDDVINKILKNNINPFITFHYDIIILDESQDITPLYYELIKKIYNDNKTKAKLCILGDKFQSVYDFNEADERFIIYAEQLFNWNNLGWKKCQLSESFRTTIELNNFINNCMLNNNRIQSSKHGEKPKYIICDCFGDVSKKSIPFEEVKYYLTKYKPDDIFILAPSIKSLMTPVRQLENKIKTELPHILVYVPTSDDEKLDSDILKDKLVFSTFHQVKGLERKVIFIFNFDESYFKFYKKNKNPLVCPNEIYVASTRALEKLIIFHHYANEFIPFLSGKELYNYADVVIKDRLRISSHDNNNNISTPVTDMIKYLPQRIIEECVKYLTIKEINKPKEVIDIVRKTKQTDYFEEVSEITGTAIPSYFEYQLKHNMTMYDDVIKAMKEYDINGYIKDYFDDAEDDGDNYDVSKIVLDKIKPDELLYLSNIYCSVRSGYIFKTQQIKVYDWLSEESLCECMKRLENLGISKTAEFEKEIIIENKDETVNRKIIGYIDCVDGNNLYEFKCTSSLEKEHYLQLAVYMYLYENSKFHELSVLDEIKYNDNDEGIILKIFKNGNINVKNINTNKTDKITKDVIKEVLGNEKQMNYLLFNILTNQLIQISCTTKKLKEMIKYLIYKRYINQQGLTDQEFLDKMTLINNKELPKKVCKKLEDNKYMILDIETCGGKDDIKIVQIAYYICDYKFNKIEEKNIIIRNSNNEVDYYQRLTQKEIIEKGILPEVACKKFFDDINKCDYTIGFNSNNFDLPVCRKYFSELCNVELSFPEPIDIMSITRKLVNAKNKKGKLKSPSQTELYEYLFDDEEDKMDKHKANYDVYILWKCCRKLYDDGKLDIQNNKINLKMLFEGKENIDDLFEFVKTENVFEQVKNREEIELFLNEIDALMKIYSKWKSKINDEDKVKKLMRLTYFDWKNKTDFEKTKEQVKGKVTDKDIKLVRDIFNVCNDRRKQLANK